ncbi:hypothetical protein Tco_0163586 [Tanacetum coccineum]
MEAASPLLCCSGYTSVYAELARCSVVFLFMVIGWWGVGMGFGVVGGVLRRGVGRLEVSVILVGEWGLATCGSTRGVSMLVSFGLGGGEGRKLGDAGFGGQGVMGDSCVGVGC